MVSREEERGGGEPRGGGRGATAGESEGFEARAEEGHDMMRIRKSSLTPFFLSASRRSPSSFLADPPTLASLPAASLPLSIPIPLPPSPTHSLHSDCGAAEIGQVSRRCGPRFTKAQSRRGGDVPAFIAEDGRDPRRYY